ncbi:MAG: hypothetical protein VZR95_07465, partial [Alphaproteobacteria bacterium]
MNKLSKIADFILKNNMIMFIFFCITAVFLSLHFRYEIIADFMNYHYFSPWAFLNGRNFNDIAIGIEHSYQNPLIDMQYYFLVEYFNDNPAVYYTYTGLFYGFLLFVFYKLCRLIFKPEQKIELFLSVIIAMTGFATLSQIGTSSNEIMLSVGVLISLYMVYKEIFVLSKERWLIFMVAGYILGLMFGLKLTSVTYCVSLGGTLILFCKKLQTPVKTIVFFAFGGILGFLTSNGYWMYILYNQFGNPFFPFCNNIFKSPYFFDKFISFNDFYK